MEEDAILYEFTEEALTQPNSVALYSGVPYLELHPKPYAKLNEEKGTLDQDLTPEEKTTLLKVSLFNNQFTVISLSLLDGVAWSLQATRLV